MGVILRTFAHVGARGRGRPQVHPSILRGARAAAGRLPAERLGALGPAASWQVALAAAACAALWLSGSISCRRFHGCTVLVPRALLETSAPCSSFGIFALQH